MEDKLRVIVSMSRLKDVFRKYPESEKPTRELLKEIKNRNWNNFAELKSDFRNASTLRNRRAVFNIAGNNYRMVTKINYDHGTVYVRFLGSHKDYDKADVLNI
jgi:mRNA interferase HigB